MTDFPMANHRHFATPNLLRWIVAVIVLFNILLIVFAALTRRQQRNAEETAAIVSTRNICQVLERTISGIIKEADLGLLAVRDEYGRQNTGGKVDRGALNAFIQRQVERLPQLDGLRIADAGSFIRYGTGIPADSKVSLIERDFFKRLRDDDQAGLFISKPLIGLISHKPVLIIARRINHADGSFAGIVYGPITLDYFDRMFSAINLGAGGVITLRDEQMDIIARHPKLNAPEKTGPQKLVSTELEVLLAKGQLNGTYFTPEAGSDHVARRISYQKIGNYPMFIIVGRSANEYLATWKADGIKTLILVLVVISCSVAAVWTIFRTRNSERSAIKQLSEQEEKYRNIFENAPVGIFQATPDGRFLTANSNCAGILGFESADAMLNDQGRTLVDLYAFPEHGQETLRQVRQDNHTILEDVEVLRKDGRHACINLYLRSTPNQDANIIEGFVTDVTDRKLAGEEKAKLEAQLIQSQKMESLGRLAGGVAHDFNNMLSVILSNSELAMNQLGTGHPVGERLEVIVKATQRSADLTRQMLAFARQQPVQPKVLDLNFAIEGMLRMLRRIIGEDIAITWIPGQRLWRTFMDPTQVDQILANLLVNSRDAIKGEGKVTITTQNVHLDRTWRDLRMEARDGDFVLLTVSDDGCGMDVKTREKIFEPFFTTKPPGQGTGLGLATVYGTVHQNGGFINVYSEPRLGTTFKVYLPRHLGAEVESADQAEVVALPKGTETVVLVEDNALFLQSISAILGALGYNVLPVSEAKEAIRLAQEFPGPLHLLLTDVVMPGMNGRDLAHAFQSAWPGIKCLFMSGYTADIISRQGILHEGLQFIQKPFSSQEIANKIRSVLDAGPA